jgi:hypothetical protein
MATGTPATKTVALRGAPELGETRRLIVAEVGPEDAPETVIQAGKPETIQGQEAVVCTVTATLPPEAGAWNEAGETE